jgi:pyridoxine kinase
VRAICLPTTLYGRRPDRAALAGGPPGGGAIPANELAILFAALAADGALPGIDLVLSGYLGEGEQTGVVLDAVKQVKAANPNALYVCDPVIGDAESSQYVSDAVADGVKRLAAAADLITPNAWELARLTAMATGDVPHALRAARQFGKAALVTSVTTTEGIGALFSTPSTAWLVETPRIPIAAKGAGDLFTALFLAHRLNGRSVAVALEASAGATYDVIVRSLASGDGDLAVIESQDKLVDPDTWPTAQPLSDQGR